jgi:hypothetical protein
MSMQVYAPKIQITLKKNLGRKVLASGLPVSERFSGTQRTIDLTPYLTERSSVTLSKSTRDPAGGFEIELGDMLELSESDTLYAAIEPLDVIELRMARNAAYYKGGNLPLMMCGFVSTITREEQMGQDGRPLRQVIIRGQDWGSVLQFCVVEWFTWAETGQNLMTFYNLYANFGIGGRVDQTASDFLTEVVNKVVNPYFDSMRANAGTDPSISPVRKLGVESTVKAGIISPIDPQTWQGGDIRSLLDTYLDTGPYNELYVRDDEDQSVLVYRPNPFRDVATGKFIQDGAWVDTINVTDDELQALSATREHNHVFNYYWIQNDGYDMIQGPHLQWLENEPFIKEDSTVFLRNYPNSNVDFYGLRPLRLQTAQGPRYDGADSAGVASGDSGLIDYFNARRKVLVDQNRDNVVLETGVMNLMGSEDIKAGVEVTLRRGSSAKGSHFDAATNKMKTDPTYYCHSVTHRFQPFRSWTVEAAFDRGMGFVSRVKSAGGGRRAERSRSDLLILRR